jgi:hypothetical protein
LHAWGEWLLDIKILDIEAIQLKFSSAFCALLPKGLKCSLDEAAIVGWVGRTIVSLVIA